MRENGRSSGEQENKKLSPLWVVGGVVGLIGFAAMGVQIATGNFAYPQIYHDETVNAGIRASTSNIDKAISLTAILMGVVGGSAAISSMVSKKTK